MTEEPSVRQAAQIIIEKEASSLERILTILEELNRSLEEVETDFNVPENFNSDTVRVVNLVRGSVHSLRSYEIPSLIARYTQPLAALSADLPLPPMPSTGEN